MNQRIRHPRIAGFTFVELMLGLVITALVMTALASLTFAVATQWKSSDQSQAMSVKATQSISRVQSILRQAKLTGLVRAGSIDGTAAQPAALMFWYRDVNQDSTVQFSEMALLQHDPAGKTLNLYTVQWPTGWSVSQKAAADWSANGSDLSQSTAPEDFKSLANVVAIPLLTGVVGVRFTLTGVGSATQRPTLDYVLNFQNGADLSTEYGSVSVRGPNNSPVTITTPAGTSILAVKSGNSGP